MDLLNRLSPTTLNNNSNARESNNPSNNFSSSYDYSRISNDKSQHYNENSAGGMAYFRRTQQPREQSQSQPAVLDHPRQIRSITIDRCSNFMSGGANGNDMNLLAHLYRAKTNSEEFISLFVHSVPDLQRIPFEQAIQQEFRPTRLGEWFGPSWVRIPDEFAGQEVHFIWNSDNEAMIWSADGAALQGLTGGAGSDARHEYILTTQAEGGEVIQLYVEMACNGMFGVGNGLIGPPDPNRFFNLSEVALAIPNRPAWDLLYDFQIILGMAKDLPEDSLRGAQALFTANKIINAFRPNGEELTDHSVLQGLAIAKEFLASKNGDAQHTICAIGHCHIDTAWLWPFEETIRKAARSWSAQIQLMDQYPEYKFIASQAQQYQWVKDHYPSLYHRVQEKVGAGQFLPTGGTWVEMDTHMPCGESLVRQFLLGQRFFESEFGRRCRVFWLPDSFGYSSQLPQLMKLADMPYFFTQKLSWNNVNKFPLTTFWWLGLDGTQVLTHMAPSETYNAQCTPEELLRSVKNHKDKVYTNTSLLVYGNGDGGGGPLPSMIERLKRMKNVDGLPKCKMALPVEFFERVERTSEALPSWKGELYFELHRGIYTTQSFCKKLNRTCEFLLRDVEILATFAMISSNNGANNGNVNMYTAADNINKDTYQYPTAEIDELWKMICLPQFHDVMSGSAIEMVYEDCLQLYTKVDVLGKEIRDSLINRLLRLPQEEEEILKGKQPLRHNDSASNNKMHSNFGTDRQDNMEADDIFDNQSDIDFQRNLSEEQSVIAINTLAWSRKEIVEVPITCLKSSQRNSNSSYQVQPQQQYSAFGSTGYILADIKALSAAAVFNANDNLTPLLPLPIPLKQQQHSSQAVKVQTDQSNNVVMENRYLKVIFDNAGHLIQLYDKQVERELIKPNERGNVFKLYEDIPLFWDAWDVEIYHLEKYKVVEEGSVQILEQGPLRASLLIEKRISNTSRLRQIVILTSISRRLDFDTEVDWNENRQFLKVEFAWDILTDVVNYECQYGFVTRPTHYNTTWEAAKFEVAAQKFADMSEHGYGVALLNDCKYGYSAHGNKIRLSLLRSPKAPDSNCDVGHHSFRYAVYPHPQHFLQSNVVQEGYNFNSPLLVRIAPKSKVSSYLVSSAFPQFKIDNAENVILDTIKKAEDSNDIIIRLYEAYGGHANARLVSSQTIKKAVKCNILEDYMEDVSTNIASTLDRTFSTNLRVLDDDVVELQQMEQEKELNKGILIKLKPFEVVTLKISL